MFPASEAPVLFALLLPLAAATTVFPVKLTCPVGGEVFEGLEIGSTSQFGMRLDLRPVGPAAKLPLNSCPSNGFVMYQDDWTPAQLEVLGRLVASPAFLALRGAGPWRRALAMEEALAEDPGGLADVTVRAAWEAEDAGDLPAHAALLELAVARVEAAAGGQASTSPEWWTLKLLAAELRRQRGDAAGCLAALDALPVETLAKDRPEREAITQMRGLARLGDTLPAVFGDPVPKEARAPVGGSPAPTSAPAPAPPPPAAPRPPTALDGTPSGAALAARATFPPGWEVAELASFRVGARIGYVRWPGFRGGEPLDDDIIGVVVEEGPDGTWKVVRQNMGLSHGTDAEFRALLGAEELTRPCGAASEDLGPLLTKWSGQFAEAMAKKDGYTAMLWAEALAPLVHADDALWSDHLSEALLNGSLAKGRWACGHDHCENSTLPGQSFPTRRCGGGVVVDLSP